MKRAALAVSLGVSLVFGTTIPSAAFAQKKDKGGKKEDSGPSASASWSDPVESEKSDKPAKRAQDDDAPKPEPKRKAEDKGRTRDKVDLFAQVLIGFGKAPENNPSYTPGAQATLFGFQLGGRYDFTPAFSAGLRVPLTMARIDANTGTINKTAFGAPELFGEYRVALGRLTHIPIGFGVGIPVAQGTPDRTNNDVELVAKGYVNSLADATSGWRDSELFQPKALPIIVGGGIRHERRDFELHADLKFVMLAALDSAVTDPMPASMADAGTYKINGFALREVTTLGGTYNILDKPLLYAGLDFALVWTPIETYEFESAQDVTPPSSVQAVLEPRVGARFGKVAPSLGYIAPLGGRLGDGDVGGVRLKVDILL